MKAYRIIEWLKRYEVTEKGKAAGPDTPIENLRKSPLPYVRFPVHGHAHGPAYRKLLARTIAPGEEMAVFGLFAKLLELAANQTREFRGWILDEKQKPASPGQIAEILGIQDRDWVQRAMEILCDPAIEWLEYTEFPLSPPLVEEKGGALWGKEGDAYGGKRGALTGEPFKNETETKLKVNKSEIKESPASSGEDSDSVSDSSQKGSDSVSVTWGSAERRKKVFTYEIVCQVLKPIGASDRTTLRHIFEKIEEQIKTGFFDLDIFNKVQDAATECLSAHNRMAMFVAVAKERFGYQPKRDRILKKAYDTYA